MKEIKLRAWNSRLKLMSEPFTIPNLLQAEVELLHKSNYDDPIEWLLFLGLPDKQGKEICEGDRLYNGAGTYRTVHFVTNRSAYYAGELRLTRALALKLSVVNNKYEKPDILAKE